METAGNWREKEFSLQTTLIFFFEFWVWASGPGGDIISAKLIFRKANAG
ncbi:hypothetical protein HMPREF9946_05308 [Acetobacteraceae bacterium AT-5844]|nr:hypothetical protein HMPREF9946_05308 [Acetobacteraceae bacterium AT-5844]